MAYEYKPRPIIDPPPITSHTRKLEQAMFGPSVVQTETVVNAPAPVRSSSPFNAYSLRGTAAEFEDRATDAKPLLGEICLSGQATILYAQPNSGKTLITLHLLLEAVRIGRIEADLGYYCNADDSSTGFAEKLRIADTAGFHNHIIPRWGKVRLTDIDTRAVAQWLGTKREEGLAPATVLKIKMIFARSFELGAQWGVAGCERNPVRAVQSKPVNNARERYLTADEAVRLRSAALTSRNTQLPFIIDLLLYTGCRVRELLDARWENVDIERRAWLIPTSKTNKPRRVPLSQAALDVIASLPRFAGCPWLVPNPETKLPFVSIKHAWQGAREAAGLYGLRIHDLRHSAASFMVNSGVDLFAVGKVLGHASYQSTQRYSHLANDTLLAAVEAGAAKQIAPAN